MLELIGLSKSFDGKPAIADVSLTVRDDEYLTLLGPSGSGKTTLLRLIAGLERPDAGRVALDGEDITAKPTHMRGLGFVQQNYALFPHMNVAENVAFGLRHRLVRPVAEEAEVRRRVEAVLALVGLEGLGERMVGQISGGQKQRVSLARTLVTEPKICLLDEPLGALDANLRERMTVELRRIRSALGVTFLHVTGNETEALAMGDRMIVLDRGRLIQVAPPPEVYARPATVEVARFLNAYNILPGETRNGQFIHAGAALAQPDPAASAAHYVVRYDRVLIDPADAALPGLDANFVASEFMGARVVYFFRRPDGRMIEVERHLSLSRPLDYRTGETHRLAWRPADVQLFDRAGRLIAPAVRQAA
jgi:ABC-type Fe3+/spermidine/putrescine transport system ATPase subunit